MTELRQIVRIIDADILGNKNIYAALRQVTGVSFSFSNAVCHIMNFDKNKKVGSLSDEEIKKIEDIIKNPLKYKIPNFVLNRRKDYDTGEDKHLVSSDLKLITGFDVKRLKKVRSYRGIRHAMGLPMRGQRTKGHFRRGKTVGVRKKGIQAQAREESKEKKGKEKKGKEKK